MEKIGFMFAGQGAQTPGMGAAIAQSNPAAEQIFKSADRILGYALSDICFNGTMEQLTPCAVCQPAIFTVSIAAYTAYLSEHDGVEPAICAGLSLGEFSAACTANVFDFENGLKLVAARGRLMDECCRKSPGGMAAVLGGNVADIEAACREADIDIANYNCPGQIVISGEKTKLEKASTALAPLAKRVIPLTVAGAYHSRLMSAAAEAFGKVLDGVAIAAPKCGFVQNVTGGFVSSPDEIRANLKAQVSSSVRWEQCARAMMGECDSILEFGPGSVLSGFVKRIDRSFPAEPAITE